MSRVEIINYAEVYQEQVLSLILTIQQDEYQVPITREDQPDLLTIPKTYQHKKGNFWLAIEDNQVIGTIALIDIGKNNGALRKMFVKKEDRGRDKGVAKALLNTLFTWCLEQEVAVVYLGTTSLFLAAHRFYEKNGFIKIKQTELPHEFPLLQVDTHFYKYLI